MSDPRNVDTRVAVLRAMHNRRLKTYKTLGFMSKRPLAEICPSQLPFNKVDE